MIKSLRIGAYDVGVEWVDGEICDELEFSGRFQDQTDLIQIKKGMQHWKMVDALLHEVGHAIIYQHSSGTPKEELEEYYVSIITNGLSQVLRDNPELVKLLLIPTP